MDEKVVLRFRDGRTERATLSRVEEMDPIDPTREVLVVRHDDGSEGEVPFADLKAVFFPHSASDEALEPASGSKISVEFNDGEVIHGTAHYNPERNGFFLFPDDRTKNERIFIVNSAIVAIEVEKL